MRPAKVMKTKSSKAKLAGTLSKVVAYPLKAPQSCEVSSVTTGEDQSSIWQGDQRQINRRALRDAGR